MVALDRDGHLAVGTSTNGLTHKIPGYVDFYQTNWKMLDILNKQVIFKFWVFFFNFTVLTDAGKLHDFQKNVPKILRGF